MYEWRRQIQQIVDEIDGCIRSHDDAALTLRSLSRTLGYSEYYTTRKFREISGMQLRDYLRRRRLAFALREVRDSERSLLDIALDYGFSSHEAFTRAFKDAYGVTPSAYRAAPRPVVLRTKIHPFDRYFLGLGEIGMATSKDGVKTYFVTIPAHKFLHIENRESNGYWDFWQKQALIPGQDCETICGLLESIQGKLDDDGGEFPPLDTGEIKQGGGTEQDHQRCAQIRLNHNKCDGDGNSNGRNDYAAQGADFFVRRIAEVAGELQNDGQFHQFGRLKLEETEVYPALGAHAGMSGDINDKKQKEREQIKRSGDFIVEFGTNQCGDNHNAQSHAEADSLIECPRCHFASGGGIKGNAAYGSQKGNDEDENKIQVKKAFFER